MSLSLGQVIGYLGIDDSEFDKGLADGESKLKRFAKTGAVLGKAAGVAVAGGIAVSLAGSLDTGAAQAKLAGQLGLSAKDAAIAGKTAGDLYRNNFGADLPQVNEAVKAVIQNMNKSLGEADFKPLTAQVLSLADAFDTDLNSVTVAAGQLMKTGMATDAQDALDIITKGFQSGADKSGDFLDTLNEYGTQFRKLGMDGPQALGLITQGLKAGARDSDIVADAIKEFTIRAVDGSVLTAQGFKDIGLNAKTMATTIAKGGPDSRAALDTVLDRLRAMKDPVKQAATATALFGTQAEDLGKALFALDPSEATAQIGDLAGAAQTLSDTTGDTQQGKLETYRRKLLGMGQDAVNSSGPLAAVAAAVAMAAPAVLGVLGPIGSLIAARAAQAAVTATATAAEVGNAAATRSSLAVRIASTAGTVAGTIAGIAARGAIMAWTAAQWLLNAAMSANPIVLVVLAIVGLVAVLVLAWKHSETFRKIVTKAFDAVLGAVRAAWNWIKGNWPLLLAILTGPIGLAVLAISKNWDKIVSAVKGMPGRIKSAASGMWDGIKDAFRSMINWIIDKWNGMEFKIGGQKVFGKSLPGVTIGTPNIPRLAQGGTVRARPGGTLALLGEGGHDERVTPLDGKHDGDMRETNRLLAEQNRLLARLGADVGASTARALNHTARGAALAAAGRPSR
jgi:phage-related minor tail protein